MSCKERSWKVRFLLSVLALVFLSGQAVYSQTQAITATLNGTVMDSAGQAVTGAKVTLTSAERGISRASSKSQALSYTGKTGSLWRPARQRSRTLNYP